MQLSQKEWNVYSVRRIYNQTGKMDNKLYMELRDYLESFIENNKDKKLHALDVSIHLTRIDEFKTRLALNFAKGEKDE